MKNNNYIGWIPCVNGNLDFGLMKVGIKGGFTNKKINDENVIEENHSASGESTKHDRLVILQSKVNWRDSPEHEEDLGSFRLFVTAKASVSDDMGERSLQGDILLYPLEAEPLTKEKIHQVSLHELSHSVNSETVVELFPKVEQLIKEPKLIKGLHKDCFRVSLNFSVSPSGLTRIRVNPLSDELDEKSAYIVARQAFYYLKYSIHSHKHHDDEQDSLTTITPESPGCGLRLVCQLKRELTSLSRAQRVDNRVHETSTAKGIIGYAKSLLIGLNIEGVIDDDELKREIQYFNNVAESFESQECSIARKEQRIETIKAKSKVWLGFSLIFLWGLTNFSFSTAPKQKIDSSTFWFIPILIVMFVLVIYAACKAFYRINSNPKKLMKIYSFTRRTILERTWLPIASILLLLIILLWRNSS